MGNGKEKSLLKCILCFYGQSGQLSSKLPQFLIDSRMSYVLYRNAQLMIIKTNHFFLICLLIISSRVLRDSTPRFVGPSVDLSVRRSVGLSVGPSVCPSVGHHTYFFCHITSTLRSFQVFFVIDKYPKSF